MPQSRKLKGANPPVSPFAFSYEEFEEWYSAMHESRWEPARATFVRLLDEWLKVQLDDSARARFRVSSSRVKGVARLWAKMQKQPYREQITLMDDIPLAVDDLVGIRLTCHNNCDMTTLRDLLAGLPSSEEDNEWLCTLPETERRYVDVPKDSGYRAYHVNLRTLLQSPVGWVEVYGELQARTLLQDGWGELTHEDTYKPGVSLPAHATRLARRMADLLATVDDLAQDLRDELDRLAQEAVEGSGVVSATTDPPADAIDIRQALLSETKRAVTSLTKPATLASVAANVQAAFGTDVVGTWGGFGSFANLVRAAVPSASISTNPPGVVTPPGFIPVEATETSTEVFDEATPMVVQRIHAFDRTMPTIYGERLGALIDGLERCLTSEAWFKVNLQGSPQGLRDINVLSRYARDTAPEAAPVSNKNLNYMLRLLSYNHSLQPGLTRDEIRQLIQTGLLVRAQKLGVVEDLATDREAIEQWLEV